MSRLSVAPYFPFRRVKLMDQEFPAENRVIIHMRPSKQFRPICHFCGSPTSALHGWEERAIRDLDLARQTVFLRCRYRKVFCSQCRKTRVEDLEFFHPYQRVTKRMATYIHELCQVMTIQEVSEHLGLDWKTIKEIDKVFLEADFGSPKLDGLRILAIDEIAIKKRFHYMTVVLDYQTGRIVWMGEGRSYDTLASFFQLMSPEQLLRLEAIALDMWDPYLKAIQEFTPHVKIVFDLYHVVAGFNKVIDAVRNLEYRKASQSQRKIFKGSKFLLLMNKHRIRSQKARQHLNRLLALNKTLAKLYILKEKLKTLWTYRLPYHAQKALNDWCRLARTIRYPLVRSFAKQLQRYSYGIINHCVYPINSAKIEGANNKIKVIKRKAYGFHDLRYFTLKAIQAFTH